MVFYNKPINFRANDEVAQKIDELMHKFPDKYDSHSTVMRAGIIILHKEEMNK